MRTALLLGTLTMVSPALVHCGGDDDSADDADEQGGEGGAPSDTGGAPSTGGRKGGDDGGEGGDSGENVFIPPSSERSLMLVASGRTVQLVNVLNGRLEILSSAQIPGQGLLAGHQIFNMIKQPGKNVVYVGSANDCTGNVDWCWGNGRIDRFVFSERHVIYGGPAYEMNHAAFLADGISCAEGIDLYPGQEGFCAPGGLAFSADGSRFYVDDDELDGVEIFEVEQNGKLKFLAEGGSTSNNGLAAHPDGGYLYNGGRVLSLIDDVVENVDFSDGGNATEILAGTPFGLVTTSGTSSLSVFDLTTPDAPTLVDSLSFSSNQVRYQAHDAGASRFVIVGRDSVRTVAFDGVALTLEDEHLTSEELARQNRGVAVTSDGEWAVVAFFRGGEGTPIAPGGFTLYSIDPDTGALTQRDLREVPRPARSVLFIDP